MNQITIGLSGHIDHGKTSLVKSLTGKDTDSLKEEIKRGMTIDIGFAHFNNNISLIDVPGHEKFIKNMVAGVSSIDLAILVVAADDGIMPQTKEHFDILNLLGVNKIYFVINKIDIVDNEMIDLVELEIEDFILKNKLENSKIFKTSTLTGDGIEKLKESIINFQKEEIKNQPDIFRMFVDRVFIKKGFGTIVTGTVLSGELNIGNPIRILPDNIVGKTRSLQSHDSSVENVKEGDRAAINIHTNSKAIIKRGTHLSTEKYVTLSSNVIVKVNILKKFIKKVKNNQRIRFHLGTQEIMGRIIFIGNINNDEVDNIAFVKFEKKIVSCFLDRFIIRSYSPMITIGGGIVLDNNVKGKWNSILSYSKKIYSLQNYSQILYQIIQRHVLKPYKIISLSEKIGASINWIKNILKSEKIYYYGDNINPWIVTDEQNIAIKEKVLLQLKDYHIKNKYESGINKKQISNLINVSLDLLDFFLEQMISENLIKVEKDLFSLPEFKVELKTSDQDLKKELIEILNQNNFNSFNTKELAEKLNSTEKNILLLIKIEQNNNNIIMVNNNLIFTKDIYLKLINDINTHFLKNETLNVKQFKEITNTSRKYAVPLLEFLDKQKITYRIGNERKICK